MEPYLGKSMTRVRLKPCPRGFVVIESPYLMGEHMCQKLEIARDRVYYLEITWDKVRDAFPTPTLGITTLVRDPRSNLYKVPSAVPDCGRCGACICVARLFCRCGAAARDEGRTGASVTGVSLGPHDGGFSRITARACTGCEPERSVPAKSGMSG